MDVLMLGLSNAGKTSFVSAMYEQLNVGIGGFTVRAERPADHDRLLRNARKIRAGTFPAASDRRRVFSLQLWHAGRRVFDFAWHDYRGGALAEDSSSPQAMQLRADLQQAGGLVLLLDSTELLDRRRSRAYIRPLVAMTVRLLATREEVMPIVIVPTKWDLVAGRESEALEAVAEHLGTLIEAIRSTAHLCGSLVPVACGPAPLNLSLPALWCLYVGIMRRGAELAERIELHEQRIQVAEQRKGLWDDITSALRGETTWRVIERDSMMQMRTDWAEIEPLLEPSQRFEALFESTRTF